MDSHDEEPLCVSRMCRATGSMQSHLDLIAAIKQPHAAARVCDDPGHRKNAEEWVRATTGREPVFLPDN